MMYVPVFSNRRKSVQNKNEKVTVNNATGLVSKEKWNNRDMHEYEKVTYRNEIVEEIQGILMSSDNKDPECISLYAVAKLYCEMNKKCDKFKEDCEWKIQVSLRKEYDRALASVHDFNFDKEELEIHIAWDGQSWRNTIFSKKDDNDLYIKRSEDYDSQKLLNLCGNIIDKYYDKIKSYKDFFVQKRQAFTGVNSRLLLDINYKWISIYAVSSRNKWENDFELTYYSSSDKYTECKCNSFKVISEGKGKESLIFQNLFVRIEDCPEWSQNILRKLRQKEIERMAKIKDRKEFQRIKEEKMELECKKLELQLLEELQEEKYEEVQKSSLSRKLLSFLKF